MQLLATQVLLVVLMAAGWMLGGLTGFCVGIGVGLGLHVLNAAVYVRRAG